MFILNMRNYASLEITTQLQRYIILKIKLNLHVFTLLHFCRHVCIRRRIFRGPNTSAIADCEKPKSEEDTSQGRCKLHVTGQVKSHILKNRALGCPFYA